MPAYKVGGPPLIFAASKMCVRKDRLHCLRNSEPFRRFSKAFEKITGMHVFLFEASAIDDLMQAIRATHPICSLIAKSPEACRRCRASISAFTEAANRSGRDLLTCRCPHGLWRTVVPIATGAEPVFLYCGQVLLTKHGRQEKIREDLLAHLRSPALIDASRQAASQVQLLNPRTYAAYVEMLRMLSRQMKLIAPRIRLDGQQASVRSPLVRRAKEVIKERHGESLHLDQVASELHVNRHYLSHMFHDQTGLTFTEYLKQTRMEAMEDLLMKSDCTVTEAAFAAGFQSLSQANRVFHAETGQSPQAFRKSFAN
jgi:AraC-like DNA-binding protein/ligand-binding sensor protein